MNLRNVLLTYFCCLLQTVARAQQTSCSITFLPILDGREVIISDEPVQTTDHFSITIDELKYYVSSVKLLLQGKEVWREPNSYHLMDASKPEQMRLSLSIPASFSAYDQISFQLGIDSATNVDGVKGGDLDPVNGMYWTWQSGYINAKLEGRSLLCPTRKNRFQFHLGGYLGAGNSLQVVSLPAAGKNIMISIDLDRFFDSTDLKTEHEVMIPGTTGTSLAKRFALCFKTAQP